jgi:hypothetical protein
VDRLALLTRGAPGLHHPARALYYPFVPRPHGDVKLLRESIRFAGPAQLAALQRDPRVWVQRIANREAARRTREAADEVVCREPLRRMVTTFVQGWNRERPPVGGQYAENRKRATAVHVGAVEWLSTESGIPRGTIENLTRTSTGRSPVVAYDVADSLVAALGQPQAMYDGTLERTSRSSASCCSGSQTATARA